MAQSVAYHRGSYALCGELHSVFIGKASYFSEEHVVDQITDSEADVSQHLFRLFR